MSIPNDPTLNTILQSKPYMVNIEGSVNICMTLCGQDIQACNQVEWVSMKNMNSWLVIEPKPNANAKCSIKLAFDSESSTGKGGEGYLLEKVLISTPAYHRVNSKIFDLEVFMLYSSTQSDGTKVYVCMCSLYNGADTVAQNDWRHTTYRLMNELFGNVDKIPSKGQTMGIGSPPNPIDMENLIPREGFRNFYEYTHPNNTKVNFRIFSSPMLVSNAVLKNLQMKLYTGAEFANTKQAIMQATNPADGLFIFFSQDVTRNIDSALNGQLLEPNACPIVKETKQEKKTTEKKTKSTPSKKTQNTKKKETKSTEKKKGTKTDKKKKNTKEKFSNQEDSEDDDEEEDFENDDDEEEDFENENEEDDTEEEGFAEISGEGEKKKEVKSGSITATIVIILICLYLIYFGTFSPFYTNRSGMMKFGIIMFGLFVTGLLAWGTYVGTEAVPGSEKKEEEKQDDLEKHRNARTGLMFTLGFMIITPYFFFAIMNKLMNDPTFEGLGNYNFDPNEVLKLLNNPEFKKILQAKLIYMIILVIQVFLSFFLILSLMMKNTGDGFMTFMNLASAMSVFASLSIINYIWQRSNKPFDDYAVSELDYYSVLSMGIKNWSSLLFDSNVTLDVSELLIGNNANTQVQPSASAPPLSSIKFVQQGGNITPNTIQTGLQVPGLNKEDLKKTLKGMDDDTNKKGDWIALFQNMSKVGKWMFIAFFVIFTVLWSILTHILVKNNTNQIATTGAAIGLTLGYLLIGMMGGYLGYQGFIYVKERGEQRETAPITTETLEHYEPMEYVQFRDAHGNPTFEKLPRSMVDEIMQRNPRIQKVDGILSVNQNDLPGIDLSTNEGKESLATAVKSRKERIRGLLQEQRQRELQGQDRREIQRPYWRQILENQQRQQIQAETEEIENGAPLATTDMSRVRRVRAGTQLQAENQGRTGTPTLMNRLTPYIPGIQGSSRPPAREGDAINPPSVGMIGRRRPSMQMVSNIEGGIDDQRGDITQGSGDDAGVLAPMMRSAKRQMQRLAGLGSADDAFGQGQDTSGGEELGEEGAPLPAMTRSASRQLKRMGGLGPADDAFAQRITPPTGQGSGDEGSVMRALGRMRGALPLSGLHGDENGGMDENDRNDGTRRGRDEVGLLGPLGRMRGVLPMSSLSSDDEGIQGETHRLRGVETGDDSQMSDINRSGIRRQRRTKGTINPENFDPRVIDESRIRKNLAQF